MSDTPHPDLPAARPEPRFVLRSALGGVLMGLANLVPGVSGGTMLLATGVYEAFVSAVADLSTLRIRLRSVLVLGIIAGSAALSILMLAGPTRDLVVHRRWVMYSLFIGLTLGGVPLVWRMARPVNATVAAGAIVGVLAMVTMALAEGSSSAGEGPVPLMIAGMAGASAMVLPGVSGGYLLLLLGQYVPILSALDQLKQALSASGGIDGVLLRQALAVVVPVGFGVGLGVVGVSNLVRWLLEHLRHATLGVLLGLLLGAVVGLWPFQRGIEPAIGQIVKGQTVTAQSRSEIEPEDWPLARFTPTSTERAGSAALVLLGLLTTLAIDRLGNNGANPG
jgi:putative membrane protein